MAFQTIETITLLDTDRVAQFKITGVANAVWNTNATVIQANTLRFANASMPINRLTVTSVQYSTDAAANGFIGLYYVGATNTAIYNFGSSDDGAFDAYIPNTTGAGVTGDIGIIVQNFQPANTFNFIITVAKDNEADPGRGAWANAFTFQN